MAQIQDPPMPKYQCHKIVSALKIFDVVPNSKTLGATLYPHDPRFSPVEVDQEWFTKRVPKLVPGQETPGYFIVYDDGYSSWSPVKAFEDGYVLVDDADASLVHAAARAAHEANRLLCQAMGDNSQLPWEQAADWQKSSCIIGATLIKNNPSTSPRESHESWLRVKEADGWKYGPIKDVEKKEHPCFLPYDQLPPNQRLKDDLFGTVVRAVLGL